MIISGNTREVRGHMRYSGTYTAGPKGATARIPVDRIVPQGTGKLDPDNPLSMKANQSAEILFDGTLSPHSHVLDVQVHEALHEAGIVRAVTKVEPGSTYRLFFTAQRSIDLGQLDWVISVRIVT